MKKFFSCLFLSLFCCISSLHSQWIKTDGFDGKLVNAIAAIGTNVFVGTTVDGIFRTTNNGGNWSPINSGLPESTVVYSLAVKGTTLFAGKGGRIFVSANNGDSWSGSVSGLTYVQQIYSVISHGSYIFAGTTNGLFRSSDNGGSWDSVITDPHVSSGFSAFGSNGSTLLAGTAGGSVSKSVNNGITWTPAQTGLSAMSIYSFAVIGSKIFAGTHDGVFFSTNNGDQWQALNSGLPSTPVTFSFAVSGSDLFAAVGGDVFLLKNGASQWISVSESMLTHNALGLAIANGNLFAANFSGGVWRRPVSEMITSVENRFAAPFEFKLEQNYPNPFNPGTEIRYQLSETGFVTLKIFDAIGRETATLVNETKEAGYHSIRFDGATLSGGMYFARLTSGEKMQTRKLMLMK